MADEKCARCGQPLNPRTAVWLDLNWKTLELRIEPWPSDQTMGSFPFGPSCAKKAKVWGKGGGNWEKFNG